tara:strand:+ start:16 stop:660 length:645 start_codon:yes stop_codon:yes gene_type:complete
MDEEINIIDSNTRNEKIKNFFIKYKNLLISIVILIITLILFFFIFKEYKDNKKIEISNLYNSTIMGYTETNKESTSKDLINLINSKDPTYSPLALYFIIDNSLITDQNKVNNLFDIVIDKVSLDKEIKNLIIYKKALYNADQINENKLLKILGPIINSDSVWKSHSLYLIAEYFFAKNEKEKSKDFFNQIIILENANQEIRAEAQKRLNRDLSE